MIDKPPMGDRGGTQDRALCSGGPPLTLEESGRHRRRVRLSSKALFLLASLLALVCLAPQGYAQSSASCGANCKTCWGTADNECMSCMPNYILKDFECVAIGDGCDTSANYSLDDRDNRCKRTVNKIDFPCEPSTYNAQ